MPPHMGDRCAESLAGRAYRSLPTLSSRQQQVLRWVGSSHQLYCLPRSSSGCCPPRFFLRSPMPGMSLLGLDSSGGFTSICDENSCPRQDLSDRQSGLRELPHAEGQAAQRTHDLHRSSDSNRKGRRTLPELSVGWATRSRGRFVRAANSVTTALRNRCRMTGVFES